MLSLILILIDHHMQQLLHANFNSLILDELMMTIIFHPLSCCRDHKLELANVFG
jgi:hypothetical protein